jgi:hypothetical protein
MDSLFKIVKVVPSGDRLIATADNLAVARAAFDTAVSLWPGSAIELGRRRDDRKWRGEASKRKAVLLNPL